MAKLAPPPQSCGDGCWALDQMWAAFLFGLYPALYAVCHPTRSATVQPCRYLDANIEGMPQAVPRAADAAYKGEVLAKR